MSDSCTVDSDDLSDGPKLAPGAWWIDDEANWRPVDAESEQPYLRDPATSNSEALSFLYGWLGMIRIDLGTTETTVEWDVQTVQPASLEEAKCFLDRHQRDRHVILHYCYGGWCRERFPSAASALERLLETEAYRHVAPFEGPTIHPIDLQKLDKEQLQQPIRQALQLWEAWQVVPGQSLLAFFESPGLLEDVIFFRRDEAGQLVYARIGESSLFAQAYGHQQTSELIGLDCGLDPDHPTLQNPICEAYETVLASGSPRYDRLRATYSRNDMRHWISCERLLLPFTTPAGEEFLVSVCCALETVAIPMIRGSDRIASNHFRTQMA